MRMGTTGLTPTIVTQLAAQGIHDVAELSGAVFSDFEFEGGALNGAQKRVIRKAIGRARRGADQPRSPAKHGRWRLK